MTHRPTTQRLWRAWAAQIHKSSSTEQMVCSFSLKLRNMRQRKLAKELLPEIVKHSGFVATPSAK